MKELLLLIPEGKQFKLARTTVTNKEVPSKAFDDYYNSNKSKNVCFDHLVLQDEKIKQGKLNKKLYTLFKELQKIIKGKEKKAMEFLKNQKIIFT